MLPPVTLPVTLSAVDAVTTPVPLGVRLMLPLVAVVCKSRLPVLSTNTPVITMFPPFIFPVALINPVVNMLPPVTLAVTLTVVPVWVVADIFPPVMLPVTLNRPVTYSPVVENTTTLLVPPIDMLALPPEAPILASLVPLKILLALNPVA